MSVSGRHGCMTLGSLPHPLSSSPSSELLASSLKPLCYSSFFLFWGFVALLAHTFIHSSAFGRLAHLPPVQLCSHRHQQRRQLIEVCLICQCQ
jgi:hypothetical protein